MPIRTATAPCPETIRQRRRVSRAPGGAPTTATATATSAAAGAAATTAPSPRKIWKHLRGAGLISGPVDNTAASYQQPTNAFGGLTGIDLDLYNLGGHNIVFGEIPGDIAIILESRGDDSVPNSGSIQASASATSYDVDSRYDLAFRQ